MRILPVACVTAGAGIWGFAGKVPRPTSHDLSVRSCTANPAALYERPEAVNIGNIVEVEF